MKIIHCLTLVAFAALAGCGSDPLVGTWGNSTQTQANTSSNKLTLQFQSGNKITATGVTVFTNSAPSLAGCTRNVVTTGTYKETTASSTVAITYSAGTSEATNCLNASDNNSPTALPDAVLTNLSATYTYGVIGNTLTLTANGGAITYTKQ